MAKSKSPKIRCEFTAEAWGPNSGCAEFMNEPEFVYRCPAPATHSARVPGMSYFNIPAWKYRSCKDHAAHDLEFKSYRFRTVQ